MVFTSGIVDEEPRRVPALLSTACLFGVGVEPGVVGAGRGSDTLLGFEGSDSFFASSDRVPRGGCEAVVGWLFVNWIVDASICGSSTP